MATQDTIISAGIDTSQVEQGFVRIAAAGESASGKIKKSIADAGKGIDDLGKAGETLGPRLTKGQQSFQKSMQATTAQLQNVEKLASKRYELQMEMRGWDKAQFEPFITGLRQAEQAQAAFNEKQRQTQAQNAFIDNLKRQADTLGMTRAELLRYQATQLGVTGDVDKYINAISKAEGSTSTFGTTVGKTAAVLGALGLTVSAGAIFSTFMRETIAAEQEQAQLAAVLRSTGEAAGWSKDQLNEMADSLSKTSTFSSGEITQAQTRLLSYVGVMGQTFPRAMQAVIDQSARMGTSVTQSAEQVGRALDIPSQGFASLTQQGYKFAEGTKEQLEALEAVGKTAEAQAFLLEAFESSVGGAALAAKNTLGGALSGLKNAFNDLMTGDAGTVSGMTASIKGMEEALRSEGMQQAFNTVLTGMKGIAATAIGVVAAVDLMSKALAGVAALGDITLVEDMTLLEKLTPLGAIKGFQNIAAIGGKVDAARAHVNAVFEDMDGTAQKYGDMISKIFSSAAAEVEKTVPPIQAVTGALGEATGAAVVNQAMITEYLSKFGSGAEKVAAQISIAMAQAKKDFGGVVPPEVEAQITKFYTAQSEGAKAAAKATKEAQKAYEQLSASISKSITDSLAEQEAATLGLTKAETELLKLKKSGEWAKFTASMQANLTAITATRAAQERALETERAMQQAMEAVRKEREASINSVLTQADGLDASNKRLRDEIELIGKSAQEQAKILRAREAQKLSVAELHLAELRRAADATDFYSKELYAQEQIVEKLREQLELLGSKEFAEGNAAAQREIQASWDQTSQLIGQTLFDALSDDGFKAAQYLKRLFSTLILQPVVQVAAQGFMGAFGGSAVPQAGGGFMSQLQNAGGGFTNWSGWGGSLSSGIGNLGNSIGGGLGESLVSLGSTVSEFDAWLSKVPGFEGGIGSAAGYAGAIYQLFQGNYGSGIGSAIGTAIMPGIGTMLGGLIGGWIDGLDGSGDPHRGAVGHYQTGYGGENYAAGVTDYDADIGMGLQVFAAAIGGSFESFLASFGQSARVDVAANWADDFDGEGESWGGFVLQMQDALGEWKTLVDWSADGVGRFGQARDFGPGEEGYAEFITAVSQSYVEALKQVDLPEWASGMLDSIASDASIETIATTLNQLAVMRETLGSWQTYLVEFGNVGDAAFGALLDSMGGFENLSSGVSSFVDLYYSEQEKLELQQKQLTDQLAKMNVELPASKDAWRELVDGALAAGEGGAELAALLLSLGPAFAQYADGAEAAAQAQIDAQQAVIDALYSDAGISGDTIAQILRDGMLGRLTQEDVGAQLSSHIIDGIYNSIAGGFAQQITDTFTSGIITPLLQAAATGSAMSGVVSQASIDAVVGQARASVAALQAILNDPALQQAIADINATISGLSIGAPNVKPVATVTKPRYSGGYGGYGGAASSINAAADNFARIAESLQDVIDRWRLDVLGSSEAAQQNLEAEFAILTAQARAGDESAAAKLPDIMSKLLQYTKENSETLHEQMLAQIKYMNSLDETSKIVAGLGGGGAATARRLAEDYEFLSGVTGAQHDPNSRDGLLYATRALERGSGVDDLLAKLDYAAELSASSVRAAYEAGNLSKEDLQSAFLNSYQSSLQQFETTLIGGLLGNQGYGEYAPAFSNAEYAVLLNKLNDLYAAADLDRNAAIGMTVHPEFNEIWKKLFGFSEVGAIGSDQQEAIKRWEEIQKQLSSIASFDVGTARVPSTGLAVLHKDERVLTAMENDVMVRSVQGINQGWQSLVNGIEAMRAELAEAKAELQAIRSSSEDTAGYTRNTSRTLDEVTNGGEAMISKGVVA